MQAAEDLSRVDWELVDDLLTIWTAEPVLFSRQCLGVDPWSHSELDSQVDILRAPLRAKSISVRAGHKTGKTFGLAQVALWFYLCKDSRVVLTAPTDMQIEKALWFEIWRLVNRSRMGMEALYADLKRVHGWDRDEVDRRGLSVFPIPGELLERSLRDKGRGAEIFPRAAANPNAFSGTSGANVAYLADEANGIDDDMFEALEGNRAGGSWLIMTGNATQPSGHFYESHTLKSTEYLTLHTSSEDVARLVNPRGNIRGLATLDWVEHMAATFGREDMRFDVRVRGNFPQAGNGVIRLRELEAGNKRWAEKVPKEYERSQLVLGVDVADQGDDDTVITGRRGMHIYRQVVAHGADAVAVCGVIAECLRKWMLDSEGIIPGTFKPRVHVDSAGLGAGVLALLRQRTDVHAVGVNNANNAYGQQPDGTRNTDLYENVRTQLWFEIRDFLQQGGALPESSELTKQLLAPAYDYTARNLYRVDSKDVIKKQIGRSPDHAESLGYAVIPPPPEQTVRGNKVTIRGL